MESKEIERGRPNKAGILAEQTILEKVKENQPISVYNLTKKVRHLGYSSVRDYVTLLEAKGKVSTARRINEGGRAEKLVFVGTIEIQGTR